MIQQNFWMNCWPQRFKMWKQDYVWRLRGTLYTGTKGSRTPNDPHPQNYPQIDPKMISSPERFPKIDPKRIPQLHPEMMPQHATGKYLQAQNKQEETEDSGNIWNNLSRINKWLTKQTDINSYSFVEKSLQDLQWCINSIQGVFQASGASCINFIQLTRAHKWRLAG